MTAAAVEVRIRSLSEEDAPRFLELRLQLDAETAFMMVEPGERARSEEVERNIVKALLRSGDAVFVADCGGRLVGYLHLERGRHRRNKHTALIVVGVLREFWGRGLGRALIEAAERWAEANGIHRLELTVMTNNDRAVVLYRRMGFETEGVRRHSMRVEGAFLDEWMMAKLLGGCL